ncbi:hypothetical protein F7234_12675 [Pseudomonas putida]|uniref:hypothetical protein n=1 Tax=Pseudomonas putida TaxID=303 RepID=UPI001260049A|nr:hypothetical protein [Pseudomonas putida]KAB5623244.1 hypothetical protein F7234_12675 [Pseudomonas putida]
MNAPHRAGSLNPHFGIQGLAELPQFGNITGRLIASVISQEKQLLACGYAFRPESSYYAMARFTQDGKLDETFGSEGKSYGKFDGHNQSTAQAVATSADRIWLLGSAGSSRLIAARFDKDGKASPTCFELPSPEGAHLLPESARIVIGAGQVLACASFEGGRGRVFRLDCDGQPGAGDTSYIDIEFVGHGIRIASIVATPTAFFVVGTMTNAATGLKTGFVARYLPDGTRDRFFGDESGFKLIKVRSQDTWIEQLQLRPSGELLVVGKVKPPSSSEQALAWQFTSSGAIDTHFNHGNPILSEDDQHTATWNTCALQADGKVTLFGQSSGGDLRAKRLERDGSPDEAFILEVPLFTDNNLTTVQRDKDVLLALNSSAAVGTAGFIVSFLIA